MLEMDTRTNGSVLAVLAAYQNNPVTSKMSTPPDVDQSKAFIVNF